MTDKSAERGAPAGRGKSEVQRAVAVQRDRLAPPLEGVAERLAQRPAGKPVLPDPAYGAGRMADVHPGVVIRGPVEHPRGPARSEQVGKRLRGDLCALAEAL